MLNLYLFYSLPPLHLKKLSLQFALYRSLILILFFSECKFKRNQNSKSKIFSKSFQLPNLINWQYLKYISFPVPLHDDNLNPILSLRIELVLQIVFLSFFSEWDWTTAPPKPSPPAATTTRRGRVNSSNNTTRRQSVK